MLIADFPLFPDQASTMAGKVDALYLFLIALTGTVSLLVFLTIFYFAIKYRRRPGNELAQDYEPPKILELTWIIVPSVIFVGIFIWASWVYFELARVPDNSLQIYATGKQWMWKFQHPSGQREINVLHVPVNRPIKVTMASEDVIHSLYFPAFRVKMDVLPNRYRTMWFQATKTGRFHIFCAEYCGTLHSGMVGWVEVMEPTAYQTWLAGGSEGSMASEGQKLFQKYACNTCHTGDAMGRGPVLNGVYGASVMLSDNTIINADDNYIRESILNPQAKVVKGFGPPSIMPTFQGQVNEDDLLKLLAYVKSLGVQRATVPVPESPQSFQSNAGAPVGQTASPTGVSPSGAGAGSTAAPGGRRGPGGSATTTAGQSSRSPKKP